MYTKAKSNYRGSAENPAIQKFYIHFFIDNYNVNFILYTWSCPKLKSGQLKVYKLMFALELSMKKWIKKKLGCWIFSYTRDNCFWLLLDFRTLLKKPQILVCLSYVYCSYLSLDMHMTALHLMATDQHHEEQHNHNFDFLGRVKLFHFW